MSKYLTVVKNTIIESLTYRLNFVLWRIRNIVTILMGFFLWQTVYASQSNVFGYNEKFMLTYILMLFVISGTVLSTQTFRVADEINWGRLGNILLKPINYFKFVLARDIADKLVNTFFSLIEISLIVLIFKPNILYQVSIINWLLFFASIILAALLYFELGMMLSFIGFWSKETWSVRFIFLILVMFLAGTYFPLNILPKFIFILISISPFPYLVFFPLKIYFGNSQPSYIISGFLVLLFWVILFWRIMTYVWQKGLKLYTGEGQ